MLVPGEIVLGDVLRRPCVSTGSGTLRRQDPRLVNVLSWRVLEARGLMPTLLPADGTVNIMEKQVAEVGPFHPPLLAPHLHQEEAVDL